MFSAQTVQPVARLRSALLASGLLLASAFAIGYSIRVPINTYDEGLTLVNASRLMDGEMPYRDFWSVYPPGLYYLTTGLIWMFGANILILRIFDVLIRLLIVASTYALSRRLTTSGLALVPAGLATLYLGAALFYGYVIFPALLLALWTLLAYFAYLDRRQLRWLWLSGVGLGLAVLFRLDFAAYAAGGLGLTILLRADLSNGPGRLAAASAGLVLSAGAAVVVLPFLIYQGLASGPGPLFHFLIVVPMTLQLPARHLLYPNLITDFIRGLDNVVSWRLFALDALAWFQFWPIVPVYGITLSLWARNARGRTGPRDLAIVPTAGIGGLLFVQALSRFDKIHVLPTMLFLAPCLTWLFHQGRTGLGRQPGYHQLAMAPLLLLLVLCLPPAVEASDWIPVMPPWRCYSDLPRAGCVWIESDQATAVKYIQARTASSEPIFVGDSRHDIIYANDASFYFLADRPSATFYSEFWPGVINSQPVQAIIVSELRAKHVAWVVTMVLPPSTEPNLSSVNSGVQLLDNYLHDHYRQCAVFGRYTVWLQVAGNPVCP